MSPLEHGPLGHDDDTTGNMTDRAESMPRNSVLDQEPPDHPRPPTSNGAVSDTNSTDKDTEREREPGADETRNAPAAPQLIIMQQIRRTRYRLDTLISGEPVLVVREETRWVITTVDPITQRSDTIEGVGDVKEQVVSLAALTDPRRLQRGNEEPELMPVPMELQPLGGARGLQSPDRKNAQRPPLALLRLGGDRSPEMLRFHERYRHLLQDRPEEAPRTRAA